MSAKSFLSLACVYREIAHRISSQMRHVQRRKSEQDLETLLLMKDAEETESPFCGEVRRAFLGGESSVFERIDRTYRRPFEKYLRARFSDGELVRDLVQEIFLKVYRFRSSIPEKGSFSRWIWTIARNTGTDYYRSLVRSPWDRMEFFQDEEEVSATLDPESQLLILEHLKSRVQDLARDLTFEQKRILWLRWICRLSLREIAFHLDTSVGAVKASIHRSQQRLRLSEDCLA